MEKFKTTIHLPPEEHRMLNEMYSAGLINNERKEKSAIVCEGIRLKYQSNVTLHWKNFKIEKPIEDIVYLIYGNQLKAHFPGKSLAIWDGKKFIDYKDSDYFFREYEVNYFLDLMQIPHPE